MICMIYYLHSIILNCFGCRTTASLYQSVGFKKTCDFSFVCAYFIECIVQERSGSNKWPCNSWNSLRKRLAVPTNFQSLSLIIRFFLFLKLLWNISNQVRSSGVCVRFMVNCVFRFMITLYIENSHYSKIDFNFLHNLLVRLILQWHCESWQKSIDGSPRYHILRIQRQKVL